jgi:hypothetical protein
MDQSLSGKKPLGTDKKSVKFHLKKNKFYLSGNLPECTNAKYVIFVTEKDDRLH